MKQILGKPSRRWTVCPKIPALLLLTMTLMSTVVWGATGSLYLVGLGPGDPELATVKALRLVRNADLIYTFSGDILERFTAYLKDKEVRELLMEHIIFVGGFLTFDFGKNQESRHDQKALDATNFFSFIDSNPVSAGK